MFQPRSRRFQQLDRSLVTPVVIHDYRLITRCSYDDACVARSTMASSSERALRWKLKAFDPAFG
jgi:hypothetical protein